MSGFFLILEISDAQNWQPFRGCRRIPTGKQPSVLHPSREIAEAEALRLNQAHPDQRFAVFEAVTVAHSVRVPTHITLGGAIIAERNMPALVEIGEEDVPF